MSAPQSRKRKEPHDWGSNLADFAVREGKMRKTSAAPRLSRRSTKRAQKPLVAAHTDELHRVAATIAAEDDIDEILSSATDPDADSLHEDDTSDDGDDTPGNNNDNDDDQQAICQSIDCSILNRVLDHLVEAFGQEIPDIDTNGGP
ncbi:hypothetical protein SPI_09111 [Niveomyces insectorum RCEF 264]|uniref:Uncharacterized protein n=1 Tax=Niveomyces insectorum RCEF 264 TaxID=1081102 RepID=A0A167M4A8_9HYPO|nr:hypothetical protein SPI_09111 [Niveomyces insectorum RCEF 264]